MIAVGIDISKSKSTVAILDSYGTVLATPFNMAHTQLEMNALVMLFIKRYKSFDEIQRMGNPISLYLCNTHEENN